MVYYDGLQNDARTNVSLALTAIHNGAIVTNYTEVVEFIKSGTKSALTFAIPTDSSMPSGRICGARIRDNLSGEVFTVRCKGVISGTLICLFFNTLHLCTLFFAPLYLCALKCRPLL